MIYITGDTHSTLDIEKIIDFCNIHKDEFDKSKIDDNYIIICGDCGVIFDKGNSDAHCKRIYSRYNCTFLFVDGNHENFDELNKYDVIMYKGGKVHKITENVYHLLRGQVFTIEGKKIFTFGGAVSTDQGYRKDHINWWQDELPSKEEMDEGLKNLEKVDNKVDYIISHDGPLEATKIIMTLQGCYDGRPIYGGNEEIIRKNELKLRKYLQEVANNTEFKYWYFGHWHDDRRIDDKYFCLLDEVLDINNPKMV